MKNTRNIPAKRVVKPSVRRPTVRYRPAPVTNIVPVKEEVKPVKTAVEVPTVLTEQNIHSMILQQPILTSHHLHIRAKAIAIAEMFPDSDVAALDVLIKRYPIKPGGKTWWNWNGAKWEKKEGI
jgi:hypothetical protein